jgi:C4-dicarboxylate-specific signal transduction histidine kinase
MVQLSYEFQGERNSALNQVRFIEKNYLPLITNSVWDYDVDFLNLQIQSISNLSFVCYAKIKGIEEVNSLKKCDPLNDNEGMAFSTLKLIKNDNEIGNLEIGIDLQSIESVYLSKAINIFLFQALKTSIVCFLLLIVFSNVIMKYLLSITEYVKNLSVEDSTPLVLVRDNDISDEITTLVNSINMTKEKLHVSQLELKRFNIELEKKVEERTTELEVAKAQTIESSKLAALGEMAGGIAHEINNPLTIIAGSVMALEKAREKETLDDKKFYSITNSIKSTVKRISTIVNGLKSVSRFGDSNKREEVFLNEVFNNVFGLCTEKFKVNGVKFEIGALGFSDSCFILGNQVLLSQVFINLLNNAYDAVSGTLEPWIAIEGHETSKSYVIKIVDSGLGVPEAMRDKIFNPFFTSKDIGKGTGLGLSISHGIVRELGGELYLDIDSENTCFIVELMKPNGERLAA